MKIFFTGASGFIGRNTAKRLIESGHECICLIRENSKKEMLESIGCQFVTGDIADKGSLIEGMKGCEAVINLANLYSFWEPDISLYRKINVDGTRNVMEAALLSDIKKVIHVSTIAIYGRSSDVPIKEESPVGVQVTEYARTKYDGDKVAWELFETNGLPLVMIYPCAVLGADDPKSTGDLIRQLVERKMPIRGLESSVFTWVHVKDVAESIVRALEKEGNLGERYIIGKEHYSVGDFNKAVSEISGVPLPLLSIPGVLVKLNAFLLTALANITKRPPAWGLSIDFVNNGMNGFKADGSKAERELGISYTPVRMAIKECIESIQSNSNF